MRAKMVKVRCRVEEECWCMQWSGEVRPELAMIPDIGVFLHAVSTSSHTVADIGHCLGEHEIQEVLACVETQGKFPGRLKLPFVLSSSERRECPGQIRKPDSI
jgi:hypothetical protein